MSDSAGFLPALSRPLAGAGRGSTWMLVALIGVAVAWFHLSGPLGPDVSWLITVSERILSGQVLYVDILEPNPPMAGFLYMPPVLLAHLLGRAPEPFVVLYTIAFALVTTGFAARTASDAGLIRRAGLVWPVTLLLFGCAWGEDFAQREHFAAMAALPLMVALALRASGGRPTTLLWVAAGLCGGFMLAIKPHFALAILLPALYAGLRQRSIRPVLAPELWLAGGIFVAFAALIWFAYPAFLTNILPVATSVYMPDRRDLWTLVSVRPAVVFEAILVLALVGFRREIMANGLLGVLFASGIGFSLSYLAQGKGYDYQILPGIVMLASFVLLAFADRAGGKDQVLAGAAALLAAVVLSVMPMLDDARQWRIREPLQQALQPYGPGLRIANVLPDLTATSPLHRLLDAELINSGPALLMSLSAYRLRVEKHPDAAWLAQIDGFEDAERVRLREDFKQRPPDLIVTTRDGFDWLDWARKDPELATLLTGFEDIGEVQFKDYRLRLLKRHGLMPRTPS